MDIRHGNDQFDFKEVALDPKAGLGSKGMNAKNFTFDESFDPNKPEDRNMIARESASNKRAMTNFLNADNNNRSSPNKLLQDNGGAISNRVTDRNTNEWLNHKLRCHLDSMID